MGQGGYGICTLTEELRHIRPHNNDNQLQMSHSPQPVPNPPIRVLLLKLCQTQRLLCRYEYPAYLFQLHINKAH